MTNILFFFKNNQWFLCLNKTVYILLILFLFNFTTYAQEIIRGTVVDRANEPIPGVTSSIIFDRVTIPAKRLCTKAELPGIIEAGAYDVVLMVGAGDIDRLVEPVKQILEKR